jgi:hypothetical protein
MTTAPEQRLHHAERLLGRSGVWARCAVWLVRLALEHALDRLWRSCRPELARCSMRAQLLALGKFRSPEVTRRVTELWDALSWAAHHHPYELAPTSQEIRGWLAEARLLVAELTPP